MKRGYHSLADLPQTLPLFPLTGVVLLPRGAAAECVRAALSGAGG